MQKYIKRKVNINCWVAGCLDGWMYGCSAVEHALGTAVNKPAILLTSNRMNKRDLCKVSNS
jgi:hypothetical protein